ncbi:RDD family protein [Moraxella ovis]|uniref:RDD family protein n=1 Tax=Moraxella ovis TaxID=29433 RepID=UPI000D85A76A|nr:RDD family protein [Moraxella ovis]SPX85421.1 RDD family [Moraxella ovis]STZ06276.1 RDD family [Moraxella ovis]
MTQSLIQHPANNDTIYAYAGFWVRFFAQIIDGILFLLITLPVLYLIYGEAYFTTEPATGSPFYGTADVLISLVFPLVACLWFWMRKGATPGKMLLGLKVLDAKTGNLLTLGQALLRYVGYILSSLIFCLGYIWVGFDKKKQGWHDKIAKTVVVREAR